VADRIRVARIGTAHGIRGEVRLWSFTADPLAVSTYGPLETKDGARRFTIEAARPGKEFLVVRIAGISDRNAAEKLRNTDLFVPRDRLPTIEEADTFYHADLVGLAAVSEDGVTLGKVIAIHNFGAGDIVEIERVAGGSALLLPFTETTVPTIDIEAGCIVVVPPIETEAREED